MKESSGSNSTYREYVYSYTYVTQAMSKYLQSVQNENPFVKLSSAEQENRICKHVNVQASQFPIFTSDVDKFVYEYQNREEGKSIKRI